MEINGKATTDVTSGDGHGRPDSRRGEQGKRKKRERGAKKPTRGQRVWQRRRERNSFLIHTVVFLDASYERVLRGLRGRQRRSKSSSSF